MEKVNARYKLKTEVSDDEDQMDVVIKSVVNKPQSVVTKSKKEVNNQFSVPENLVKHKKPFVVE